MDKDLIILTVSHDSLQLLTGMYSRASPCSSIKGLKSNFLKVMSKHNNCTSSGARTSLVKVKARAGKPLNRLAD
jgi:hypothetical protein